jgi:transcriptional regulator with XRE-family HTH domain
VTGSAPSRAPRRANDLGPVGRQVARSIEALREDRRLTQKELAARMTALGRPATMQMVSRIEQAERRVDVDDLAAIAQALGVAPAGLLQVPGTAAPAPDHPAVREARILAGRIDELLASTGAGQHDTTERTAP